MLPEALAERAALRHGILTRAELLPALGRGGIQHRVEVGALVRVQSSVYRIAGAPRSWRQRLLAATLAAGRGGVASFRSAGALFGLEEFEPDMVELTLPRGRRPRTRAILHESNALPPSHVTVVDAIPTTTVARTLFDLTAVRPRWATERAVDLALSRRLTSHHELVRVFGALARRGRRRCTIMRELLEARDLTIDPGESAKERQVAQLLVRSGLPRPEHQHAVRIKDRTYRLDLAYPAQRVAIEYDGWAAHSTRSAFDRDRSRQNDLSLAGWRILRFTSATSDSMVAADVAAALELASRMQAISA